MDSKSSLGFKYDLDTEIGIKSILVAIRKSQLPISERNEMRDLVFLFINGGRDETVRNALMQKLVVSGLEVKDLSKKQGTIPDNAPALSFGLYREAPTFLAPVVVGTSVTATTPTVVVTAPASAIIPPVVTPPPTPATVPLPAQPTVSPVATMSSVATPVTSVAHQESMAAVPAPVLETSIITPTPTPTPTITTSPAPMPTLDLVTPSSGSVVAPISTGVLADGQSALLISESKPEIKSEPTPSFVPVIHTPILEPVATVSSPEPKVDSQPPVAPVVSTPVPEVSVASERGVEEVFSNTPPAVVPSVEAAVAAPLSVPTKPTPAAVPTPELAVPPVANKVEVPLPAMEKEVVSAPVPVSVPASVVADTQTASSYTTTNYLNRIRDIKASVNNKVGNPVNLIDIDNEVGREYMNALLDAMKKVNGGLVGELDEAMARLETAFVAVDKAVANNGSQTQVPDQVSVATENNSEVPSGLTDKSLQKDDSQIFAGVDTTEKPSKPVEKSEIQEEKAEPSVDLVSALSGLTDNKSDDTVEEEETVIPLPEANLAAAKLVTPAESGFADPEYKDGSFNNPVPRPAKESIRETVNALKLDQEVEENKTFANPFADDIDDGQNSNQSFTPKLDPMAPAENSLNTKLASIAEEKTPLTPLDLPEIKDTDKAADPLFAREVDDGLDQLLADWTLFKKSGLFGTGPKGREHPLFKKMAELQIPLILSGRFDGATQEIKQSVTDYMNGWRYEQGVVYEQGETFELYLRRVIRHILDLQK